MRDIIIHLEGGVIQDIELNGNDVIIEVRDYDVEGADEDEIQTDENGRGFYGHKRHLVEEAHNEITE